MGKSDSNKIYVLRENLFFYYKSKNNNTNNDGYVNGVIPSLNRTRVFNIILIQKKIIKEHGCFFGINKYLVNVENDYVMTINGKSKRELVFWIDFDSGEKGLDIESLAASLINEVKTKSVYPFVSDALN